MPALPAMTARTRWLLGGGVAAAALAVVSGTIILLGGRPVPEALRYVPANSVVVAELRLDLPGDQFQKVGNLLAHFPGFADQSTLGPKLDEALDRLSGDASNGSVTYTANLKPWLAGPTFVGILGSTAAALPSPGPSIGLGGIGPLEGLPGRDGVVVTTTDGKVGCEAAIPNGTKQTIAQGTLLVDGGGSMACFMDGKFGLLGTPTAIEAALAAHAGGTGIDHDAAYAKAREALGGDRIATVYASGAAALQMEQAQASPPASFATTLPASVVPEWLIAGIRAEDDALVTDLLVAPPKPGTGSGGASGAASGSPLPSLPTLPPPHPSDIAGFLPGNTVLLGEAHGVGVVAQGGLEALRSDPEFKDQASQLDAALSLAGGAQGVVGWITDAGVVVIPSANAPASGPAPGGDLTSGLDIGIVLVATDEATATAKVSQLTNLLSLIALSNNGTATPVNVDGTTVTTIDLGSLSGLLNQTGAGGSLGGLPIPSDVDLKFSIAARGKLVLLGGDDAFARDVIGVQAGGTLADQAAYKRAFAHAAASNLGQVYVAGQSLRDLAGRLLPADQQARWQSDILPYAQPVDAVLVTTTIENGISHTKLVVTVSTPPATPAAS